MIDNEPFRYKDHTIVVRPCHRPAWGGWTCRVAILSPGSDGRAPWRDIPGIYAARDGACDKAIDFAKKLIDKGTC